MFTDHNKLIEESARKKMIERLQETKAQRTLLAYQCEEKIINDDLQLYLCSNATDLTSKNTKMKDRVKSILKRPLSGRLSAGSTGRKEKTYTELSKFQNRKKLDRVFTNFNTLDEEALKISKGYHHVSTDRFQKINFPAVKLLTDSAIKLKNSPLGFST